MWFEIPFVLVLFILSYYDSMYVCKAIISSFLKIIKGMMMFLISEVG